MMGSVRIRCAGNGVGMGWEGATATKVYLEAAETGCRITLT
jgi:hypothetical protein